MLKTKRKIISDYIIFVYFLLFPFGQILRLPISLMGLSIVIQPIDLIAFLSLFFVLEDLKRLNLRIKKEVVGISLFILFSILFSLSLYSFYELIQGLLYLSRLIIYSAFFCFVYLQVQDDFKKRRIYFQSLICVSFFTALFGWVQYFLYPDTRALYYFGWDDHLYRLISTFLDPGFTAIILTFGFILAFCLYCEKKNRYLLILPFFFLITLLFTYSRAGYLALFAGSLSLGVLTKKVKPLFGYILIFMLFLFLLPRPGGEGVRLERTASIYERVSNYQKVFSIWKSTPLFGVGYNNLCLISRTVDTKVDTLSHSCSGSDSSVLLLLSTFGLVGFFILLSLIFRLLRGVNTNLYGKAFISCVISLLVHSQFVNSLFYPWVFTFMVILLALSYKKI